MTAIFQIAARSYRDSFALFNRAGSMVLMVMVILAAGHVAGVFSARLFSTALGKTLAGTLSTLAAAFFAAPYIVRLTRLVLEDRLQPALEVFDERMSSMRYFAWTGVFAFLGAIPQYGFLLTPPITSPSLEDADVVWLFWVTFLLLVALWIFTARTVTLLPAVALGHDITLRQALAKTRGHFWFVVFAVFLPIAPLMLVGRALISAADGMVFLILSVALSVLTEILALVVSATLYRWFMDNVK